ncbi:hypothetical protein BGZ70_006488, partial [Mortierella alpina]
MTQVQKLEKDCAEGRIKGTKRLYRRIKSLYRAPPEALQHILEALEKEGWAVCRCAHQADTCIARCIENAADPDDVRVITKDSDLIVYRAATSITLAVGNDWKTFAKEDLLGKLNLPTPDHLLLLCSLTTNDYTDGVPYYGLVSNADLIRSFELDDLSQLDDQAR